MKLALIPVFLLIILGGGLSSPSFGEDIKDKDLERWRSYEYGMFIHFGMATFTGRANENDRRNAAEPSTLYAPTDLDVDQWVRVARDAGMKYAVLTAKHTAGHCLWDSKVNFRGKEFDHDVATSGDTTDVVAEFVKACKKYGIEPGLYWCLLDWRNNAKPGWHAKNLPDEFYQFTKDQLAELIQRYPEVSYYWLDIPRAASFEQRSSIYEMIKELRPGTVVLYNHGLEHKKGVIRIENFQAALPTDVVGTERYPVKPGDFTPRQEWKGKTYELGYEHCDTIVRHWFWVEGDKPRSVHKLYQIYKDVVAAGGNFLLNVPPDTTGRIPESSVRTLMEIKKAIDDPTVFPVPLSLGAKATASNYFENNSTYAPEAGIDNDAGTRWATDDGTHSAWLAIDLGKPTEVGRLVIRQAFPELKRVKAYSIEYLQDGEWQACYQGKDLGADLDVQIPPVTARKFRLNITESKGGPTIWEFQLFPVTAL